MLARLLRLILGSGDVIDTTLGRPEFVGAILGSPEA